MRYAIKFSKESEIKFISHLDLMRTIQRIVRRAKLPVEYSKGFNPHMSLSIAQPLSVGIYSTGEYMDMVFEKELEENEVKNSLNENCPQGIRIIDVVSIPQIENVKRVPQSMALVEAASYSIKIKYNDTDTLDNMLKELLNKAEWNTIKKSKSGEKEVNIKTMIRNFDYKISKDVLNLEVLISTGSRENLSPELLAAYIKNNTEGVNEEAFVDIRRKELYTVHEKKIMPLVDYFKKIAK